MNKSGLIDSLQSETGLSKAKAEQVVDIFFDTISEALARGDRVEIRGFCSIFVKDYKGYIGRNPKTGTPVEIPPKKLPFFKCGKELKERVDY
ncbi:MAG: integration host factor subunit beta [Deltaproteobacteria bacterium]|nr:integration host factor subunit beta [Deltaproteobacteria bacterium]MBW2074298.1 integration host factor subunit beta [Deltaproteobacteria bacterium]RLB82880.1 MAG: integration host factor subunit beta [Deltaproteobacteria bacterium]